MLARDGTIGPEFRDVHIYHLGLPDLFTSQRLHPHHARELFGKCFGDVGKAARTATDLRHPAQAEQEVRGLWHSFSGDNPADAQGLNCSASPSRSPVKIVAASLRQVNSTFIEGAVASANPCTCQEGGSHESV